MLINNLIERYKCQKGYSRDKQIACDLNISTQKLSAVRVGTRYLTESELLFLAKEIGEPYERLLLDQAYERSQCSEAKVCWQCLIRQYLSGTGRGADPFASTTNRIGQNVDSTRRGFCETSPKHADFQH